MSDILKIYCQGKTLLTFPFPFFFFLIILKINHVSGIYNIYVHVKDLLKIRIIILAVQALQHQVWCRTIFDWQ